MTSRFVKALAVVLPLAGWSFINSRAADAADRTSPRGAAAAKSSAADVSLGREIFLREWVANDPRSHGGDGLGPVFNDTSCVSCHNQGGVGGGGSEAKNVIVITAARSNQPVSRMAPAAADTLRARPPSARPIPVSPEASPTLQSESLPSARRNLPVAAETPESRRDRERQALLAELNKLHPGLAVSRSVVLHKSGTNASYAAWRDEVLGLTNVAPFRQSSPRREERPAGLGFFGDLVQRAEEHALLELQPPPEMMAERVRSLFSSVLGSSGFRGVPRANRMLVAIPTQRSATALFGVGLIDSIPDSVLEAAAKKAQPDFPEISGRAARLKDGKIGRFGWKSQTASLYDFTMTACAVELGLHVPDHPQAGDPQNPEYQPAGFDLNQDECLALVGYLKELPAPVRLKGELPQIADEIGKGEELFTKVGCAACHQPNLGEVAGIYSDLLLHDMGPEGADSGEYGVFQPKSPGKDGNDPVEALLTENPVNPMQSPLAAFVGQQGTAALNTEEPIPDGMIGAGRQEWRTPPLWGVRDSAPYLHDGRAKSLEQAIAFHGGEAQLSANRFYRLQPEERAQVLAFLRSLVAPAQ
jgi:CxxC motif-containing protein (DUF1111 family)